jgi:hypothetical protein
MNTEHRTQNTEHKARKKGHISGGFWSVVCDPSPPGFAMLFAVLVSSVLLSIGISIFNLTIKELILSSSGRESQFAFYAADTGAECAIYWDFRGTNVFATSTDARTSNPAIPTCVAGTTIDVTTVNPGGTYGITSQNSNSAETQFSLSIPNTPAPYCVIVRVKKLTNSGLQTTRIDSRGYNTCDTTDITRVERALKVCYGPDCATIN